jgi:hypothetical protein
LIITENIISAVISKIFEEQVYVQSVAEASWSNDEDLLNSADKVISECETKLGKNFLVEKSVFALSQYFIENQTVKDQYISLLKKLTKELGLDTTGYIEYEQALSYYLKNQDASPPTALFCYIEKNNYYFSLIRVGKIEKSIKIENSQNLDNIIEAAITTLNSEILPSRLILFSLDQDLEEHKEKLTKFHWHKYSSVVHTPKIELVEKKEIIKALVETASVSLSDSKINIKNIKYNDESDIVTGNTDKVPNNIENFKEDFGFKREKVYDTPIQTKADVQNGKKNINTIFQKNHIHPLDFTKIKSTLYSTFIYFTSLLKNKLFYMIIFILIIILSFFSFIYVNTSATVTLITFQHSVKLNKNIILTTEESKVDIENGIYKVNPVSEEISGEKSTDTTGKSKVGEKAKGEVVIYNKTLQSKTFAKNTVIQNGTLSFTLDDEVKIASASDTGEGLSFGKVNAKITAMAIGTESNLIEGSTFTFKDQPESNYNAKAVQNFTGGSSRDIQSVSKEDRDKLEKELFDELNSKAQYTLSQKISENEYLLDSLSSKNILTKKFSHEVGEETNSLNLTTTLLITGYSLPKDTINQLLLKNEDIIPKHLSKSPNRIKIQVDKSETDKQGDIKINLQINAFFSPEIDSKEIVKNIKGKTYQETAEYLKNIEYIAGVRIINTSFIKLFSNRLPFIANKISIQNGLL